MAYAALDIAKWFINAIDRNAGESISHLKVQKLLYFAEGWSQLCFDRELFNESMQAWAHGPVVPEVFRALKEHSWNAIPPIPTDAVIDEETSGLLTEVLSVYGEFSAKTLENMTHADQPWIEARGQCGPEDRCETIIAKEKIKAYFTEKFHDAADEETLAS